MSKFKIILTACLLIGISAKVSAHTPERIVSLKPNITEILYAIGAGDRLVGVTTYCDYPPAAKILPKVADYTKPFAETLIAQNPDLIISSKEESSRKSIEELEKLGIKVELFPFTTLSEIMSSIRNISAVVGKLGRGEELIKQMKTHLDGFKYRYKNRKKQKVLIVWGHKPLIVGGPGTYMDEMLDLIGAENVVPKKAVPYPRWNLEKVIAANPDVILDISMGSDITNAKNRNNTYNFWNRLKTVSAVKNRQIHILDTSYFRPSPRIIRGVGLLGAFIHPCKCKNK